MPAGHLADVFDRRLILAASYLAEAVAAALFVILAMTALTVAWPFFIVLALFGAARGWAWLFPSLREVDRLSDVTPRTSAESVCKL